MNKLKYISVSLLMIPLLTSCTGTMSEAEYIKSIEEIEWARWTEPGNFYSIEVPEDWKFKKWEFKAQERCPRHAVYCFRGPNRIDEICISAACDVLSIPKDTPTDILTTFDGGKKTTTEITRVYGDEWDGWAQCYESGRTFCYGMAVRNKDRAILLTAAGRKKDQHLLHDTYKRVQRSLKVGRGVTGGS